MRKAHSQTASRPAGLLVRIEHGTSQGLQQQIYAAVRRAILDSVLAPGTRLPSSRALANDLCVSRTTTLLAYEQLVAEGYLSAARGSGMYVARELPDDVALHVAGPPKSRNRHLRLSQRGGALADVPAPGVRISGPPRPFRLGVPALDLFPFRLWTHLVHRRLRRMSMRYLDYGDAAGFAPLRSAIADYVQTARGARCTRDQVFIVSGAQRGLQMIASTLVDQGDRVLLEDPGYTGARSAYVAAGARILPVRVDESGLDVDAAVRAASGARMVYVTPSHQFPLGMPMSLARRLSLLRWASSNEAWIVEDDYDSEFRYGTRPLPCLQGLDEDDRVIYVGTFAKSMFPALRLGFVIVPLELVDRFQAVRRAAEAHPPSLEQMALTDFIADGHYARHLRRMRAVYRERRDALADAAQAVAGGLLRLQGADTGLHAVVRLSGVNEDDVCREAGARGVEVAPLGRYFMGRPTMKGLVLGFASSEPPLIRRGMETLAVSVAAAQQRSRRSR